MLQGNPCIIAPMTERDELYEYCTLEIKSFIAQGHRNKATKMMKFIVKGWPEKVIARGELDSDPDVSDSELQEPIPSP